MSTTTTWPAPSSRTSAGLRLAAPRPRSGPRAAPGGAAAGGGHGGGVGHVDAEFDRARVRRALTAISPLQREAVELAYFGGHSYRQGAPPPPAPRARPPTRRPGR